MSERDLLARAARLLKEQIDSPVQIHPRSGWVADAAVVLAEHADWVAGGVGLTTPPAQQQPTRWRPIDPSGAIATEPAPENPPEPEPEDRDDETGPPIDDRPGAHR